MSVAAAIAERLLDDMAIGALVGSRVYQLKLPQSPRLPAVRVQLVAEPTTYHLRGPNGLTRSVVQVDAFASESDPANPQPFVTATRLADLIDHKLSGRKFTVISGSPGGLWFAVSAIYRDNRMPIYEAPELRVVRIMQEYTVFWYELAVVT